MEGICKFDLACSFGHVELGVEVGVMPGLHGSHRLLHYLLQSAVLLPVVGRPRDMPPLEHGLLRLCGFLNLTGLPPDLLVEESSSWLGRTKTFSRIVFCPESFGGLVIIDGDNVGVEHGSCLLGQVPPFDLLRTGESGAGLVAEVQQEVKD